MSDAAPKLINRSCSFEGWTEFYSHPSTVCAGEMRFSVYLPPKAEREKVPVLYWLSGLTCTEENFMAKAGAQRWAAQCGVMLVVPDTSPRKAGVPGESDHWDFGLGAGFYVNATREPWSKAYRMYDYVAHELPSLLREHFPVLAERESIFGHSMGGHGALVLALRQPGRYRSVSAFSPISAPSQCPWGQKAFARYLGEDKRLWAEYDAHELLLTAIRRQEIFVDQGTEDRFLQEQLMPETLKEACAKSGVPLHLRLQPGYDHSFYFISTFIEDHIRYHAERLKKD